MYSAPQGERYYVDEAGEGHIDLIAAEIAAASLPSHRLVGAMQQPHVAA